MEGRAGGHDGGWVIPLRQQHERMLGAAAQQRAVDQRTEPGQDGFQKGAEQLLNKRGHIRQITRATAPHLWYNRHPNCLSVVCVVSAPVSCHRLAVGTSVRNNYPKLSMAVCDKSHSQTTSHLLEYRYMA